MMFETTFGMASNPTNLLKHDECEIFPSDNKKPIHQHLHHRRQFHFQQWQSLQAMLLLLRHGAMIILKFLCIPFACDIIFCSVQTKRRFMLNIFYFISSYLYCLNCRLCVIFFNGGNFFVAYALYCCTVIMSYYYHECHVA